MSSVQKEKKTMTGIEWIVTLLFVVPLAVACVTFILGAMWLQVKEEQRREMKVQSAPVHRRARRAAYHAA